MASNSNSDQISTTGGGMGMGEETIRTGEDKVMEVTMGGGKTRTEEVIEGGMVIEEAGSTIGAATIGTTKEVLELVKEEVALKAETHLGWSLLSA